MLFYRRLLGTPLAPRVSRNKVRLVFGARQTGKTELLKRTLRDEDSLYIDLGSSAERRHGVSFWRSASGAEVDYVWEGPREDVPVEVKWTTHRRPADARHVETFLSEYPSRAKRGLVVCRCERAEQLSDRVVAMPWNTF